MEILDNALNNGAIAAPICVPEGKKLRQETHGCRNKDDRGERRHNDSDEPIYLLAPHEPKQKSPDKNKRRWVQNGTPREGFESDLKYSLIMHSDSESTTLWCRARLVVPAQTVDATLGRVARCPSIDKAIVGRISLRQTSRK